MAFSIDCVMAGYEFRGMSTGRSKAGKEYRSLRVESPDGYTAEISCTDSNLFNACDNLRKAEVCDFAVRAVAGKERSYIILKAAPMPVQVY